MTCVVGLRVSGGVIMGCDSIVSSVDEKQHRKESKIFILNNCMMIGYAGSVRQAQLMMSMKLPKDVNESPIDYVIEKFVPIMIDVQENGRRLETENGSARCFHCLIGYRGELLFLDSDFSVGTIQEPYSAIGSGALVALGSLHSTQPDFCQYGPRPYDNHQRIVKAIQAAEYHSTSVGGKIRVETLQTCSPIGKKTKTQVKV